MTPRVLRVALTGGIATGKSYCLTRFAERGARTIDADVLAHRALAPGTKGLAAVVARFGKDVLQPHGELDRARLGRIVFEDAQARRDLEAITHPVVYGAIREWFASLDQSPPAPPLGIADIPLLYETGHERDFDRVIVAICPPDVQLARLMKRSAMSEDDAKRRIAAQMPIDEKARRATDVIDTSGSYADTDAAIGKIWESLIGERRG